MSQLDFDIQRTRLALNALVLKRQELALALKDQKIVLNPVRRISADLLGEIFQFCIDEDAKDPTTFSSLDANRGIWLLIRISRAWRTAGTSFPRLWSFLSIVFHVQPMGRGPIYLLGMHLLYAKGCPLSVSITARDRVDDWNPLLPVLLPSSLNWENLRINIPHQSLKCLLSFQPFLQSLRTVYIDNDTFAFVASLSVPVSLNIPVFSLSQKLEKVTVAGYSSSPTMFGIPLSQITEYSAIDYGIVRAAAASITLPVIGAMTNLVRCHLDCHAETNLFIFTPPNIPAFTLPNLESLSLKVNDPDRDVLTQYLGRLTLPVLHTLKISGDFRRMAEAVPALQRFEGTVQRLVLDMPELIKGDMLMLLEALSQLTSLDLGKTWNDVAGMLKYTEENCLLPRLRSLAFDSDIRTNDLGLEELKKSRENVDGVARLTTIRCNGRLFG
ncbi:hypothetical protein C8J56DRAFT_957593 [Mycena floridula]|nr:hypothetical protein C8J56DRAFT_957593 [Mycena floridula]